MRCKVLVGLLSSLFLLSYGCKTTRKKDSREETPQQTEKKIDGQTSEKCQRTNFALAQFPKVDANKISVAFPRLSAVITGNEEAGKSNQLGIQFGYDCPASDKFCSKNESLKADYGTYKVCPFNTQTRKVMDGCISGTSYFSTTIPDLNTLVAKSNALLVSVRACVNPERVANGGANCSAEKQNLIILDQSTSVDLVNLDKQIASINQNIMNLFASTLKPAAENYLKSIKGKKNLSPEERELERIALNLKHHPYLFASRFQDRLAANQTIELASEGFDQNGNSLQLTAGENSCGAGAVPVDPAKGEVEALLKEKIKTLEDEKKKADASIADLTEKAKNAAGDTETLTKIRADLTAAQNESKLNADQLAAAKNEISQLQNPVVPEPQLSLNFLISASDTSFASSLNARETAARIKDSANHGDEIVTVGHTMKVKELSGSTLMEIAQAQITKAKADVELTSAAYDKAKNNFLLSNLSGEAKTRHDASLARELAKRDQAKAWINDAEKILKKGVSVVNINWELSPDEAKKAKGGLIISLGLVLPAIVIAATTYQINKPVVNHTKYTVDYGTLEGSVKYDVASGEIIFANGSKLKAPAPTAGTPTKVTYIDGSAFDGTTKLFDSSSSDQFKVFVDNGKYNVVTDVSSKFVAQLSQAEAIKVFGASNLPTDPKTPYIGKADGDLTLDAPSSKTHFAVDGAKVTLRNGVEIDATYLRDVNGISTREVDFKAEAKGTKGAVPHVIRNVAGMVLGAGVLATVAEFALNETSAASFAAEIDKAGKTLVELNLQKQEIEAQQGKILGE